MPYETRMGCSLTVSVESQKWMNKGQESEIKQTSTLYMSVSEFVDETCFSHFSLPVFLPHMLFFSSALLLLEVFFPFSGHM